MRRRRRPPRRVFVRPSPGSSIGSRRKPRRGTAVALDSGVWPKLLLTEWQDTHDTLHMWTQIVGKTRLALAPHENHWWQVTLYVSARGVVTSPIRYLSVCLDAKVDLIVHRI